MGKHGTPDWAPTAPVATIYTVQDLGELAARLGSIDTFERGGNVIWYDDFENGLNKWLTYAYGGGAVAALTTLRSHTGCFSVRLVAGSDGLQYAGLRWDGAFTRLSRLGYEICWSGADTDVAGFMTEKLSFTFSINDGTYAHVAEIAYDVKNGLWKYVDENGVGQIFLSDYWHVALTHLFNFFKLVIDPINSKYVRVLINDKEYDLSEHALYRYLDPTCPSIILTFHIDSQAGKMAECFVDNVILTQNEP